MSTAALPFDPARIRADFPILRQTINDQPLVYLDNAATGQKPQPVIDALVHYYATENSNVHRGVHTLSQRATDAYEGAREKVRQFLNAPADREIIFVRGTTEGINLVAQTWGRQNIGPGDEIIISAMEHHSNIVPWQILGQEKGARLRIIPINDAGELLMDEYESLLNDRTKLVAVVHQSNALGTINPVAAIIDLAHRRGIPVLPRRRPIHRPYPGRCNPTRLRLLRPFPAINSTAPPALASSTAKPICSKRCPPTRAAAK